MLSYSLKEQLLVTGHVDAEGSIIRAHKSFQIAVICLVFGFIATILLAQQAPPEFPTWEVGAGASLVATSVSGPGTAILNQTIRVHHMKRLSHASNA